MNGHEYINRNKFYLHNEDVTETLSLGNEQLIYYEKLFDCGDTYHYVVTTIGDSYILRLFDEYYDSGADDYYSDSEDSDIECAWLQGEEEFNKLEDLLLYCNKYMGIQLHKHILDCEDGCSYYFPLELPRKYEYYTIGGKSFKSIPLQERNKKSEIYDYHCILYLETSYETSLYSIYAHICAGKQVYVLIDDDNISHVLQCNKHMYDLDNLHIITDLAAINNIRFDCIMGNVSHQHKNLLWSAPDVLGYIDDVFSNYIRQDASYYVPISRYESDRIVLVANRGVEFNCSLIELSKDKNIPLFLDSVSATIRYHRERKEWDDAVQILRTFEHVVGTPDNHILLEGYLCLWYKFGMTEAEKFVMSHVNNVTLNKQLWMGNLQWYGTELRAYVDSLP